MAERDAAARAVIAERLLGLEHDHPAMPHQPRRRRKPGNAAADDEEVGVGHGASLSLRRARVARHKSSPAFAGEGDRREARWRGLLRAEGPSTACGWSPSPANAGSTLAREVEPEPLLARSTGSRASGALIGQPLSGQERMRWTSAFPRPRPRSAPAIAISPRLRSALPPLARRSRRLLGRAGAADRLVHAADDGSPTGRYDPVDIKWFEDGVLNLCHNCVDRHLAAPRRRRPRSCSKATSRAVARSAQLWRAHAEVVRDGERA